MSNANALQDCRSAVVVPKEKRKQMWLPNNAFLCLPNKIKHTKKHSKLKFAVCVRTTNTISGVNTFPRKSSADNQR